MALNIDGFNIWPPAGSALACENASLARRAPTGQRIAAVPSVTAAGSGTLCRGSRQCGKADLQQRAAVRHPQTASAVPLWLQVVSGLGIEFFGGARRPARMAPRPPGSIRPARPPGGAEGAGRAPRGGSAPAATERAAPLSRLRDGDVVEVDVVGAAGRGVAQLEAGDRVGAHVLAGQAQVGHRGAVQRTSTLPTVPLRSRAAPPGASRRKPGPSCWSS